MDLEGVPTGPGIASGCNARSTPRFSGARPRARLDCPFASVWTPFFVAAVERGSFVAVFGKSAGGKPFVLGYDEAIGSEMPADDMSFPPPKLPPASNVDFYDLAGTLAPDERELVKQVQTFMRTKVAPIIDKYWIEDAFPFELLPAFKELNLGGLGLQGYGCRGGSAKLFGFVAMEMARVDPSFCTFFGVHDGLAMGSIYFDGSEAQKQKWLPPMARLEKIGCFGLTEPLVGSGTAGGLTTTAKRDGDTWILNGEKKWIGNAPWCDVSIIWARDLADNQVKGFIVENKSTPGFSVEKIHNKIALRVVQNGIIKMKDCRVPDENRLAEANSFRDTARVLQKTRFAVGWMATGCQMGAYEHALAYTLERHQFGKPIAGFQLVQDLIAKMLSNVTACQCLLLRLGELADEGKVNQAQDSLAKSFCTARSRETVAWARELLGGNGIVVDYDVARFFADAEALYSYEGTYQMQNLIIGKAVTGLSAFV
jgi:glutaryl-CoA dehydrogenase